MNEHDQWTEIKKSVLFRINFSGIADYAMQRRFYEKGFYSD
ncbi:MAG: hypothetical protein ACPL28_02150 [bacterium]